MTKNGNSSYEPVFSEVSPLSSQAARSSIFLFIAKVIRYSFVFLVQMILMNLLAPSDFGIIRFVVVIIGVINLINELGLSFAVIQKKILIDSELASAFSLNALIGGALYGIVFFCAPLCASFFGNDQLTNLVRVGALASFLGGISVVQRAVLQRRFQFGRLAIIEIVSALAGSGSALVLALNGLGVWSLLSSLFVFNILSSLLTLLTSPWPKGDYWNWAPAKKLSLFGAAVVIQRILYYGAQNFDYIFIGKVFGEKSLGIYSIAHTLIMLPQLALAVVIGSVLYSTFSRMQDDDKRLSAAFLKINTFTSVVSVPFFVIIFSFAKEMMHAVCFINHGDTWIPAAEPIQILAMLGLLFALTSYPGTIWLSKGKVRLRIVWEIVMLITIIIAVFAGQPMGINGICYALVIRGFIFFPVVLLVTYRVIGLSPIAFLKILFPSLVCGLGMLSCTMLFTQLIPGKSFIRDVWTLLGGSVGGMIIYCLILFFFFRKTFNSLLEMIISIKKAI